MFPSGVLSPPFVPVPLAVPCWNGATYGAILRSVAAGNVVTGRELGELKDLLIQSLGAADALLCGSGSLAIEIILRALGVGRGDEVVLPTFCCAAVVPPVIAVGATPVLADVGEELNLTTATVEAVVTKKTRIVIVPHLFGNPADIQAIIALVRDKRISIIDDAAQAQGATLDGRALGSFGAAGVVSFGREKMCAGLGGGAVISREEAFFDLISGLTLSKPSAVAALSNLFEMSVYYPWRSRTLRRKSAGFSACRQDPATPLKPYKKEAMANLAATVALSLSQSLSQNILARRLRVQAYRELLEGDQSLQLVPHREGSSCLNQVVRAFPRFRGDDRAARAILALTAEGYQVLGSYVPIHMLSGYEHCVWDRLSYADRVWTELVELPCEPDLSLSQVERISAIIKHTV